MNYFSWVANTWWVWGSRQRWQDGPAGTRRSFLLTFVASDHEHPLSCLSEDGELQHPSFLPVCTLAHPEAQVWIIFVMSCSLCGHQIVLLIVRLPSPHHKLHTKHGVPFKKGISEWGACWGKIKCEIQGAKSLSRPAVSISLVLLSSLQVTPSLQGHNCSPCQASKKTSILCRALQLYMLSCNEILSLLLLLLRPYILMQKVMKSWGMYFDWRMIVASCWRTL